MKGTLRYTSEGAIDLNSLRNVEVHIKLGEAGNGRVDFWSDNKILFSYRDTIFPTEAIEFIRLGTEGTNHNFTVSSIIYQDTRRIGLERIQMLKVDPEGEQNFASGTTKDFTISNMPDAAEFRDITGFGVIMQPTSRDAAITTATLSLDGAAIGTADISSSSGTDYVCPVALTNSKTNTAFTRDDIEGKKLSIAVNG